MILLLRLDYYKYVRIFILDDNDFFLCFFEFDIDCFLWYIKDNNLIWFI